VTAKKDDELRMPVDEFDHIMGRVLGSAAKAVAKMLVEMNQAGEVEIAMLDSRCLKLDLEGQGRIEPGTYGRSGNSWQHWIS